MRTIDFLPENFPEIRAHIERGNPVIFPTESSYGFSGDISESRVIRRVEKIKNRKNKSFICLVPEFSEMQKYTAPENFSYIPEELLEKAHKSPISFLLKKSENFPQSFFPSFEKVGIRKTLYKPLQGFLTYYGSPIFSTSANFSGEAPIYKEALIREKFQKFRDILFVSAGNLPENPPSEIINVENSSFTSIRK